ncbi:unnamed protein product [Lampetra fluviatilis]
MAAAAVRPNENALLKVPSRLSDAARNSSRPGSGPPPPPPAPLAGPFAFPSGPARALGPRRGRAEWFFSLELSGKERGVAAARILHAQQRRAVMLTRPSGREHGRR